MALPFNPAILALEARCVPGFRKIETRFPTVLDGTAVTLYDIEMEAMDATAAAWSDFPDGQGFGGSDTTFAVQYYIDHIIGALGDGSLKTEFRPVLEITNR